MVIYICRFSMRDLAVAMTCFKLGYMVFAVIIIVLLFRGTDDTTSTHEECCNIYVGADRSHIALKSGSIRLLGMLE